MPLDTVKRLERGIGEVRAQCAALRRDPSSLGIALLVQDHFEWIDAKTADGSARRMFTGSSQDMAEDADNLTRIGVSHAALRLGGKSIEDTIDRIARFGAEVIARHKA